jgi:hypothetical protein
MKKSISLLVLITMAFITDSHAQNGGATPNDLFTQAANAMQTQDYAVFGKLFLLQKNEKPEEIEAMVGIIKLYPKLIVFKEAGLKKFGKDFEYEVITSTIGMDLDYGVNWKIDFEAAKNATYKQRDMFGEMWATSTTRIAWEGFEKPLSNPVTAVQKDGRWYMMLATNRVELLKALEKYIPEAQKLLDQSTTAEELAEKMKPLRDYFDDFHNN